MKEVADHRSSPDDFYRWLASQTEGQYEFVDGRPVLRDCAPNRHDRVVRNAILHFSNHLDCRLRQPFAASIYFVVPGGKRRQSHMDAACGESEDASMEAAGPALVLEVLSPAEPAFDLLDRLERYKTTPNLAYIVLVDTDLPFARIYRRVLDNSWIGEGVAGMDAIFDFPLFGFSLPLADLYSGLTFRPHPPVLDQE